MDAAPSSHLLASSSAPRSGQDRLDARSPRWTSSKPQSRADDAPRWDRPSSSADSFGRRRHEDERDSRPSRSYSSLRSEGIKNATSSGGQQARPKALPKLPTADILDMLRIPRRPHVFIPKPKSCNVLTEDITEQLATTQPLWTREGDDGWCMCGTRRPQAPPTAQPADPRASLSSLQLVHPPQAAPQQLRLPSPRANRWIPACADKEARLPSFRKVATAKTDKSTSERDAAASKAKSKHDQPRAKKHRDPATKSKDRRGKVDADDESEDIEEFAPSKRSGERARSTKSGVKKRGAAAWLLESTDEEAESDDAASTGPDATSRSVSASVRKKGTAAAKKSAKSAGRATPEDSGEGTATPEVEAVLAKTKPKAAAKAKPIPADPFEAGLVEDAEDLYFLRLALDQLRGGELPTDESWPEEDEPEAAVELKGVPESACAAPHWSRQDRRHVLQSARNNRADSRRLVLGIEQHKRETATDTDMFKFNQLRTRKKQLKFAKSPIHDWGSVCDGADSGGAIW
ncbi:hypothetical protein L1887_53352 [Cichorium endivia]|nr:hypothetical protein L1887_53352 [Cichorium endivia]